MKPEHFRKLLLPLGTEIGFWGDYNAPSPWGEENVLTCKVGEYVIVKRHDKVLTKSNNLDCGILIHREKQILSLGTSIEDECPSYFVGQRLLVLHRYLDTHWDNSDYHVMIYGISDLADNITLKLKDGTWHEYAIWISSASIMAVLEGEHKSEFGQFLEKYDKV